MSGTGALTARMFGILMVAVLDIRGQTIEGRVLDASSGAGIPAVRVHLDSFSTAAQSTFSNGTGAFRFDDLEPGEYRIRYESQDYRTAEGFSVIQVRAGHPLSLEARLVAWSTISGRAVDQEGRPVAFARLELRSQGFTLSGRVYQRTSWGDAGGSPLTDAPAQMRIQGKADASGNFVLRVTPGAYSLSVLAAANAPPPARAAGGPLLAWGRSDPLRLAVRSGAVVSGVELRVEAVPAFSVRGEVRHTDGSPAPNVVVALEDRFYELATETRPDGTFELTSVPRGMWCVAAEAAKARAMDCFAVGRQNVEGLRLDLVSPIAVAVRLQTEGSPPETTPSLGALLLAMASAPDRPLDERNRHTAVLAHSGDGRLAALNVYPGRYRFAGAAQAPAAPFYLAAVLVGDQDLLRGDGMVLPGQTVTLLLRSDSGAVKGRVEHCASGSILLIPTDPERRGRGWSRSGSCSPSGDYELAGVAPGEYGLLALAGNSPVPGFDDALLQQAAHVRIRPGETATVDLRVADAPVY